MPAAAARHADEIAAKRARYQRALDLGAATAKGLAPIPEPSPIDVTHYDLDLYLDVSQRLLCGTATIDVTAARDGLRTIELDVDLGLRVLDVTLLADARHPADSPRSLPFSHADDRLALLPSPLAAGDSVRLSISYGGRASRFGDGVNWYSHRGFPEIFTFAEPFGARVWFPCNDRPDDEDLGQGGGPIGVQSRRNLRLANELGTPWAPGASSKNVVDKRAATRLDGG